MLNLKQRIRTKTSPEIGLHPGKHIIRQEQTRLNLLVESLGRPRTLQSQSVSPIIQRLVPISEGLRNKARQVQVWQTESVGGICAGRVGGGHGWFLARVHSLGNRSGVLRLGCKDDSREARERNGPERLKDGRKVDLEMTMRKDQIFPRS